MNTGDIEPIRTYLFDTYYIYTYFIIDTYIAARVGLNYCTDSPAKALPRKYQSRTCGVKLKYKYWNTYIHNMVAIRL